MIAWIRRHRARTRLASPSASRPVFALAATSTTVALLASTAAIADATGAEQALNIYASETELTRFLGGAPRECTDVDDASKICEWSLSNRDESWAPIAQAIDTGDRVNVLCRLPKAGGARERDSCSAHPKRSNRSDYRVARHFGKQSANQQRAARKAARAKASAALDGARTLTQLIQLMGTLPTDCIAGEGGNRVCTWRATSHTEGHGTVAASIGASTTKKVVLRCSVPSDGEPRAADSCFASVGN